MSTDDNTEAVAPVAPPVRKELSMSQFKSWLEGVEEMQDTDWHPSATQWKTIRNKFDMIVEPKPAPVATRAPVAAGPMPAYRPPAPVAPDGWTPPPTMPAEEVSISPAARAIMEGGKTPEVDSADGSFDSPFT